MLHSTTLYVAIDHDGFVQADEDRDTVIERMQENTCGPFRMHALNIATTLPEDIVSDVPLAPESGELIISE